MKRPHLWRNSWAARASVAYSPDGSQLACGTGGVPKVTVLDRSAVVVEKQLGGDVRSVAYSPTFCSLLWRIWRQKVTVLDAIWRGGGGEAAGRRRAKRRAYSPAARSSRVALMTTRR